MLTSNIDFKRQQNVAVIRIPQSTQTKSLTKVDLFFRRLTVSNTFVSPWVVDVLSSKGKTRVVEISFIL